MLDYQEFISNEKSMLIAPAGYGKTHTIANCLKYTQSQGKQLILTHTHAGVASIKEKVKKEGIPNSCCSVETISSFAQKYVFAFYVGLDVPSQEDKNYYQFIITKATELLKLKPIRHIISNTYSGLFVDEYQDCTIKQHELILVLSGLFKTRILGDHMQGIFDFKEPLVDMKSSTHMSDFAKNKYELDQPQRWLNGNNASLGDDLKNIRNQLEKNEPIDLNQYHSIIFHMYNDFYVEKYNDFMKILMDEESLLIIDPVSTNQSTRIAFVQRFKNIPRLIEAIDSCDFYKLSKLADLTNTRNINTQIICFCNVLFNKTGTKVWFNDNGLKSKRNEIDKKRQQIMDHLIQSLEIKISYMNISKLLRYIEKLPEINCYRKELFNMFCKALEEAELNSTTVYEAMKSNRNTVRRVGRKIYGKCIGTTLLTKGLEFDTVAIINAHMFKCPKHLYVALTRASKKLILFTERNPLNPFLSN